MPDPWYRPALVIFCLTALIVAIIPPHSFKVDMGMAGVAILAFLLWRLDRKFK